MTGMVVTSGEFHVRTRDFSFLGFVLDAQVGEGDLAADHREIQVAGESLLKTLAFSLASRLSAAEPLIEFLLQFVIQSNADNLATLAFNFVGSLVIQTVKIGIVVCFFGLYKA
jgi:hypothetical protein